MPGKYSSSSFYLRPQRITRDDSSRIIVYGALFTVHCSLSKGVRIVRTCQVKSTHGIIKNINIEVDSG